MTSPLYLYYNDICMTPCSASQKLNLSHSIHTLYRTYTNHSSVHTLHRTYAIHSAEQTNAIFYIVYILVYDTFSYTQYLKFFRFSYLLLVETNSFPKLVIILPDYAFRTSLGTFSILLRNHTDHKSAHIIQKESRLVSSAFKEESSLIIQNVHTK